jgi:hypothetical protein
MYDDRVGAGTRRLASVSDVALAAEIREALIAVLLCGDAWRAVLPSTPERQDRARVEILAALRTGLVLAGPAASVDELAGMAGPDALLAELALQYRELVAKGEDLRVLVPVAARQQPQQRECVGDAQVRQSHEHEAASLRSHQRR